MKRYLVGLFLLLGACGGLRGRYIGLADQTMPKTVMLSVESIVPQISLYVDQDGFLGVKESTVTVHFLGAGVAISNNGHILSCAHLFNTGDVRKIEASLQDGTTVQAVLIYKDDAKDLSLVKINCHHVWDYPPAATFARSARIGEEVVAVGNPFGIRFTFTNGIISGLNRNCDLFVNMVQTSAAINPGNSGGPLFNMRGELVGINTLAMDEGWGTSFAVSVPTIRQFLELFHGLRC